MARDDNGILTMLAALNTDGITPVPLAVLPSLHLLMVSDGTTGTDHGRLPASRDDNRVPVIMGVSSADLITPTEVYCDSSGNLLIDST